MTLVALTGRSGGTRVRPRVSATALTRNATVPLPAPVSAGPQLCADYTSWRQIVVGRGLPERSTSSPQSGKIEGQLPARLGSSGL